MTAKQFRHDLQIDKRWPAQFSTPGILTAITDKVDTQFAFAAFKRKVGFSTWWTQSNGCTCGNWATRHLINGNTAETNALSDLLHTHHITSEAVSFLPHLYI